MPSPAQDSVRPPKRPAASESSGNASWWRSLTHTKLVGFSGLHDTDPQSYLQKTPSQISLANLCIHAGHFQPNKSESRPPRGSVLDTDWVIEYLHARPAIVARLTELQPRGLGLSIISLAELWEGVFYSRDPEGDGQDLADFLSGVTVLGIDTDIAQRFGRERGRLRAVGMLIGDFDLLIGATALAHNLTVLTNNRSHFERIDGLHMESAE